MAKSPAYGAIIEQIAAGILRGVTYGPRSDSWPADAEEYGRGMKLGDILNKIKAAETDYPGAANWAKDATTAMNDRNGFVHTAWIIRVESLGLLFGPRLNRRNSTSSRTVSELLDVRDRLRAVWASGWDVTKPFYP